MLATTQKAQPARDAAPVLEGRGLTRSYPGSGWRAPRTVALDDVSFSLHRGEAVAVIGESGSGKSTLARLILQLERADRGSLLLDGAAVLAGRDPIAWRRRVQMVFQDPFASLNPMRSVGAHLEGPLLRLAGIDRAVWQDHARGLLESVGLTPAAEMMKRRPHELSGGQRQRVAIARALAASPDVLVADEPTSMLDVSIRVGVLDLLHQRKVGGGLALLVITHDLAAARRLADRAVVMFRGRIIESAPFEELLHAPAHPYTQALVAAVDSLDAAPAAAQPGASLAACGYAARCPHAFDRCLRETPALVAIGGGRSVRCHLSEANPQLPTRKS